MAREPLKYDEVMKCLTKSPINARRVDQFFEKEPGLREAFDEFASSYTHQAADELGVEIRPRVRRRLQQLFVWCLVVGYLTKDNLIQEDVERAMRKG